MNVDTRFVRFLGSSLLVVSVAGGVTSGAEFDCELARVAIDGGTACGGKVNVDIADDGDNEFLSSANPTETLIEPEAMLAVAGSSGLATVKMSAINLTAPSTTTRVPTVDLSVSPTLNVDSVGHAVTSDVDADSISQGRFEFDDDDESVDVHFTLKLISNGSYTGGQNLSYRFGSSDEVSASIIGPGIDVILYAFPTSDDLWTVVKIVNGVPTMLKEEVATFNETVEGTVQTTCDGSTMEFEVSSDLRIFYDAAVSATGLSQYHFSSSAWAVVTPLGETPIPGDFDGDGEVGGLDYLIWQSNYGLDFGAAMGQGDANDDGKVDGQDYLVWQQYFGCTYDD